MIGHDVLVTWYGIARGVRERGNGGGSNIKLVFHTGSNLYDSLSNLLSQASAKTVCPVWHNITLRLQRLTQREEVVHDTLRSIQEDNSLSTQGAPGRKYLSSDLNVYEMHELLEA